MEKNRINGSLNLSRAFGDFDYKSNQKVRPEEQLVISRPEITEIPRDREMDQFIVMGCDGVWERFVSNSQKMVESVGQLLQKGEAKMAVEKLLGQLVAKGEKDATGFDNMSAVLVKFK